jgi:putative protein kinase ArgK-like GTPase of G3E family
MYVMTSDFGAPSQLEKIDMLDYAELVVLNKFDKRGAEDALRDVRKQWKRNRVADATPDEDVPVYPTIASQFNDPGISWMFVNLCRLLRERGAGHIRVFGGGGGTITPEEIRELQAYGVERIYHPNDGMHMGLVAMIEDVVRRASEGRQADTTPDKPAAIDDEITIGKMLSAIEEGLLDESQLAHLRKQWQLAGGKTPVVGITGYGGAG